MARLYYERGPVKLYHGDSLEWLPTVEPGSVDAFVTSPPYNQLESLPEKGTGLWAKERGGAGFLRNWAKSGYADGMPEADYQEWQNYLFALAATATRETGSLFYNHQIRWREKQCLHPVAWFRPESWRLRSEIVWDRGGGMMLNARMFCRFDERILWFVRGERWKWSQASTGHGTVWRIARFQQQQGKRHPVEFPLELPTRCILAATDPGDLVCDPFSGGATTAVASIHTGRRFIGCELDEQWCEVSAKRCDRELDQGKLFDRKSEPKPVQKSLIDG